MRVINKIELPFEIQAISDFVTIFPQIPDSFSGLGDQYFIQFQMKVPEVSDSCTVIINTGMNIENGLKRFALLDFDLFVNHICNVDDAEIAI